MSEFSLGFSESLLRAASHMLEGGAVSPDDQRAALYLSLLSCEISLKALLEKAGLPEREIVACSHDHQKLVKLMLGCELPVPSMKDHWAIASRFLALPFELDGAKSTVGSFLDSEKQGASKYPNQVRYGDHIVHFPPKAAYLAARELYIWANTYWDLIRRKS